MQTTMLFCARLEDRAMSTSQQAGSSTALTSDEPPQKRPKVANSKNNGVTAILDAPKYGFYLSKVALSDNNNDCLSFADIVRWNSEKLVESIHFNFMVLSHILLLSTLRCTNAQIEVDWLVAQYDRQSAVKPMHLVVGASQGTSPAELRPAIASLGSMYNITVRSLAIPLVCVFLLNLNR